VVDVGINGICPNRKWGIKRGGDPCPIRRHKRSAVEGRDPCRQEGKSVCERDLDRGKEEKITVDGGRTHFSGKKGEGKRNFRGKGKRKTTLRRGERGKRSQSERSLLGGGGERKGNAHDWKKKKKVGDGTDYKEPRITHKKWPKSWE